MKRFLTLMMALLLCVLPLCSCSASGNFTEFTILEENFGDELYAIGFRKGDELTAKVNTIIDVLVADGTLPALAKKYNLTLAD